MKNLKTVVIAVLCAGLCLGYYYYLVHRDSGKEEAITEADMIITQDLDDSYPKTARGVVKFYNRILKCYYSQDYTEEQLEKMAHMFHIACGGKKGAAKVLMEADFLNIYQMANH